MIFENTNPHFKRIIEDFGGDDPERLKRQLQRLVSRVSMDVRNQITSMMSDAELEMQKLPLEDK